MGSARLNRSRYDLLITSKNVWTDQRLEFTQALFNVMLRDFGVKGVKVQEVVSLDEEMMAFLRYVVYILSTV